MPPFRGKNPLGFYTLLFNHLKGRFGTILANHRPKDAFMTLGTGFELGAWGDTPNLSFPGVGHRGEGKFREIGIFFKDSRGKRGFGAEKRCEPGF